MFNRNTKSALAVAVLLAATSPVGSAASAQEAIMLEQIGAVRMAQPEEVRRAAGPQAASQEQQLSPQVHKGKDNSR